MTQAIPDQTKRESAGLRSFAAEGEGLVRFLKRNAECNTEYNRLSVALRGCGRRVSAQTTLRTSSSSSLKPRLPQTTPCRRFTTRMGMELWVLPKFPGLGYFNIISCIVSRIYSIFDGILTLSRVDIHFLSLKALRRVFPNFDNEARKRDLRLVTPISHSWSDTRSPIYRIGDANCGIRTCMGDFFRSPSVLYPKGDHPELLFCSRDGYERLLRSLVLGSSTRIRRIAGTVTSLQTDDAETKKANSVAVSLPDGKKIEIPSALVVGEY